MFKSMKTKKIVLFVGGAAVIAFGMVFIYSAGLKIGREKEQINQLNGAKDYPKTTVKTEGVSLSKGVAEWEHPENPMESQPIKDESKIPKSAIRIGISSKGFSPKVFKVKAGQEVILAVTSEDNSAHVFRFKDKLLKKVAVGLYPGETRTIYFFAPKKVGSYKFYCSVPGHEARGEKGKMIVK